MKYPKNLEEITSSVTLLRKLFVDGIILLAVLFVLIAFFSELNSQKIIVGPIRVSESLQKKGIKESFFSASIKRKFKEVTSTGSIPGKISIAKNDIADFDSLYLTPEEMKSSEILVPTTGISVQTYLTYLRSLLGFKQDRIYGSVECVDASCDGGKILLHITVNKNGLELSIHEVMYMSKLELRVDIIAMQIVQEVNPVATSIYYYAKGNDRKAAKVASKMLIGNRQSQARAYNLLGSIELRRMKLTRAQYFFKKSIERKPTYFAAYYNWGRARESAGEWEEAAKLYERAIRINPNDTDSYSGIGNAYLKMGEYQKAERYFRKASIMEQDRFDLAFNLGNSLAAQKKYCAAISMFERVTELNPSLVAGYKQLAIVHQLRDDQERAVNSVKAGLDFNSNNKELHDALKSANSARFNRLLNSSPPYRLKEACS